MNQLFKILSIDGGGIRGVYPAHILDRIEACFQINLDKAFDMIAGTSTGAIIAAGVATGVSSSDIVGMYKDHGEKIFKKKGANLWNNRLINFRGIYTSMYDAQYLKSVLTDVFHSKRLGEIDKPLLIPSTDIGNGCVHVFKSGYSKEFTRDNEVLVRDAVLASCSAPTYFDPQKLDKYLLADGGLWANNPSFAAIIEARKRLLIAQKDIKIFTLGTGHTKVAYGIDANRKWGLINGWKKNEFINFIFSLQSQSILNYLNLYLNPKQILRIDFESDKALSLDDFSIIDDLYSKADLDFTHLSERIRKFIMNI